MMGEKNGEEKVFSRRLVVMWEFDWIGGNIFTHD
jgi:hypothetical protein